MGCDTEEGTKLKIFAKNKVKDCQIQGSGPAVVLAVSGPGGTLYLARKTNLGEKY